MTKIAHIVTACALLCCAGVASSESLLRIREGSGSYGKTILSVEGNRVRLGGASYGSVLYTIDGNQIREGNSSYGKVLATVQSDGRVTEGSGSYGRTIANVRNSIVREGSSDCFARDMLRVS